MSSNFLTALAGSRLYPLTDRFLSGLSHTEQVLQLSAGGARLVQLREKIASPAEFYEQAREALQAARAHGMKVIINDRVDVAQALHADGVHLGQDDLPAEAARRLLGPQAIIGFSTHDPKQAKAAAQMPVDYIAIGPIFATQSKESPNLPVGLAGLRHVRQAVGPTPLVAIGGVTLENARSVLEAGADAVSAVSNIWQSRGQADAQVKRFLTLR
jgi:thiamine-phosphate pyrophosphorylase